MSRFIKLTNMLINTNDIHNIHIQKTKYYIDTVSKSLNGFNFFGCGFINTQTDRIEVCETKHPIDYKIVTDWISKNS